MNTHIGGEVFRYWGKADISSGALQWHPLPYHCLDVAAVASVWWEESAELRDHFVAAFRYPDIRQLRGLILFLVALHDIGKFNVRFQLKSEEALKLSWPELDLDRVDKSLSKKFDHGLFGCIAATTEASEWFHSWTATDDQLWKQLVQAVTGHHGDMPVCRPEPCEYAEADVMAHDVRSRAAFVSEISTMLLPNPLAGTLPECSVAAQQLLAGFCSICDWIGSNSELLSYTTAIEPLCDYFNTRVDEIRTKGILKGLGLRREHRAYMGVSALLGTGESPRGVQVNVDQLPIKPGLTIVEAPTGAGKTEAALAYAWRLIDAGLADSIVFALPTQATANAMLTRAEVFAEKIFGSANVVLAHGKRDLNHEFERLLTRRNRSAQGREEAAVECTEWLASSRKRVFLGQIGVCTIDQVLLSVLPVRHKFVRAFGINKSVLIVDEVHAYDAYMYGLLGEVLRRQKAAGGSAILLSATLPGNERSKLFAAWDTAGEDDAPYPALWHAVSGKAACIQLPEEQRPPRRVVEVTCHKVPCAFPTEEILKQIVAAAESGALVGIVMNLVDDAQKLARALREKTDIPVDLFHARYRFADRQVKEQSVDRHYGRYAPRDSGRILVGTQVIEQSLDLDLDWLVTQICPIDLLFQRLGRLHRHDRTRPAGFETPRCLVLSVEKSDYGLHTLIYGNTRVLWRTEQVLGSNADGVVFPEAYRNLIKYVYGKEIPDNEPDDVIGQYLGWEKVQLMREAESFRLMSLTVREFHDDDSRVTALTRDGEMAITVLPITPDGLLLDGQPLEEMEERQRAEALNFNAVPVPASWGKRLLGYRRNDDRYVLMHMTCDGAGNWTTPDGAFRYSQEFGLEAKASGRCELPEESS